jgi:outer membrane scaffolding protein for murein synthesis (MipA/OmpV family)
MRHRLRIVPAPAALLLLLGASAAQAVENTEAAGSVFDDVVAHSRWVLGASLNSTPDYAGSSRRELKLSPVYAFQYGRFRFSAGGAGGLLNFGTDVIGPGASAEIKTSGKLRLGASLRIDGGRSASDSPDLAGLPEVRRTLRGRLYASTELTSRWTASASLAQDLLGRGGGALLAADLGYALPTSPRTTWTAGGGVSFGDRTYMQSYYGVSSAASLTSGLAPFDAGAGPRDLHAGLGWTSALTPRWIAFATLGASRLLGDAATSPLTHDRNSLSASVGIAYRCCKP